MRRAILVLMLLLLCSSAYGASMEMLQIGIAGSLSTNRILLEELTAGEKSIILGTSTGIFIFTDNGKLDTYIQTASSITNIIISDDITGDSRKDPIVSTTDAYYPNVKAYDSSTGAILWEFSPKSEVCDPYVLWTLQQMPVFDIGTIGDLDGDSIRDIVLTAGYNLYALSGKTGGELWVFGADDNTWDLRVVPDQNSDSIQDIAVGDQTGTLSLIDGSKGTALWTKQLAADYAVMDPIKNSEVGRVTRSVWDIVQVGDSIAVSAEDGYVYLLDLKTGETKWQQQAIEYVDSLLYQYYGDFPLPTSRTAYNFFNLRLTVTDDVTGDGTADLIASTFPGMRSGTEYKGSESLILLDSSSGEQVWKNDNIELNHAFVLETVDIKNTDYLAIPLGASGGKERLKLIEPGTGETFETLTINSSSSQIGVTVSAVKGFARNRFILLSGGGDLFLVNYPGDIAWNYPRFISMLSDEVNLVGDSAKDILLRSRDGADTDNPFDKGKTRLLFVMDGSTRKTAWSYELQFSTFSETGGLSGVKLGPDINKDGTPDIVGYIQYFSDWNTGDEYGNKTRIMAFDGKTGALLFSNPLTNRTYYADYETYFSSPSALNTTLLNKLYQKRGTTSSDVYKWEDEQRNQFLAELNQELEQKRQEILGQKEEMRIRKTIASIDAITDMSGDGIKDFVVGGWNDIFIIDSVSGETLWTRTYREHFYRDPVNGSVPKGITWNWTNHDRLGYIVVGDANGDAMDDLVLVSPQELFFLHSNTSKGGLDYHKAASFEAKQGINNQKVTAVGDVNSDGVRDIFVEKQVPDAPSVYLILSGKNGKSLLEVEREGTMVELNAADFDGDSSNDSIIFKMWGKNGPTLDIMSGTSGDTIWSYTDLDETWMLRDIMGFTQVMPATPVGDRNGDGAVDLAFGRSRPWNPGGEVLIYDIKNNKVLQTITAEESGMERSEDRWMPSVDAKLLPDMNADGKEELGIIMVLGEAYQKQTKVLIVDLENEEVISDFLAPGSEVMRLGKDSVGIVGSGAIYVLDTTKDLSIISPQAGAVTGSPVVVGWQSSSPGAASIVSVDGNMVVKTNDKSAEFEIAEGEHKISVHEIDSYGKGVYDSVEITVEKSAFVVWKVLILALSLLGLLLVPKVVRL